VGLDRLKMLNHGYTSGYTDVTRNLVDKIKTRGTADDEDEQQTEIIREIIKDSSGSSTDSKKKKKKSQIVIGSGSSKEKLAYGYDAIAHREELMEKRNSKTGSRSRLANH